MSTVDIIQQIHGINAPYAVDEDNREDHFDLDEYLFQEWDRVRSGNSLKNNVRHLVLSSILQLRSIYRDE